MPRGDDELVADALSPPEVERDSEGERLELLHALGEVDPTADFDEDGSGV